MPEGQDLYKSTFASQGGESEVIIKPAASRAELADAYDLVYDNYLRRGYIAPNEAQMRMTLFNAFPNTLTFVAMVNSRLVATLTLVDDTPVGLPMDEIYHDELQALRDEGRHLTEVTMLADRRLSVSRSFFMLLRLMKNVFDCGFYLGASDLCITVNPHHDKFYREYLLFTPIGGLRAYPSVANNPALARRLDLNNVREACTDKCNLLHHFFDDKVPSSVFDSRYRMTISDIKYFFMERLPIVQESPEYMRRYLKKLYPGLNGNDVSSMAEAVH